MLSDPVPDDLFACDASIVEDVLTGRAHAVCVLGDALEVLRSLPSNTFHAGIADPPAGIGMMSREWDDYRRSRNCADVEREDVGGRFSRCAPEMGRRGRERFVAAMTPIFAEILRVLRPGALCPVWAYPGTAGWTQIALEDAGFRMYPPGAIFHLFGQGWNKSPSQIRPGLEVWWLAQKPWLRTQAANVERWGCGGMFPEEGRQVTSEDLNGGAYSHGGRVPTSVTISHLDGCVRRGAKQVLSDGHHPGQRGADGMFSTTGGGGLAGTDGGERYMGDDGTETVDDYLCFDGCPVAVLDAQSGTLVSGANPTRRMSPKTRTTYSEFHGKAECVPARGEDAGGASRFFSVLAPEPFYYAAKISPSEAAAGCSHLLWARDTTRESGWRPVDLAEYKALQRDGKVQLATGNIHPTRKSARLTAHLARLSCPPGGVVINPFAGSGGEAVGTLVAHLEPEKRLRVVSIEQNQDYHAILEARTCFVAANHERFARRVRSAAKSAPAPVGDVVRASRRTKAVQGKLFE